MRIAKALVVIDVQKAMFSDPSNQPHDADATVERIADLIAHARRIGVPIFFAQHDGGPDDSLRAGEPGFAFHEKLTPAHGDDVTVKQKSSAFHGTDFDTKLKHAGIDHLIVTGMQSEYCVDSAIRGAYERGYRITLVSDAHSTFDTKSAKAKDIIAIQNETMGGSFARVVSAAAVSF